MQFVFIAFQSRGLLNITKVLTTCFSSYNSFLSNQTRYRTSPSALFSLTQFLCLMNFEEKYFPLYILLTDQTSLNDCVYFWGICQYVLLCLLAFQFVTSKTLKFTFSFLSSHFPAWPKKSGQKLKYLKTKRLFHMKWKSLLIIFKGNESLLKQIKPKVFGRWVSDFNEPE